MEAEQFATVVALTVAAVTALKNISIVKDRIGDFVPFLSLAVALGLTWLMASLPAKDIVVYGLIAGFSACGLYDAAAAGSKNPLAR